MNKCVVHVLRLLPLFAFFSFSIPPVDLVTCFGRNVTMYVFINIEHGRIRGEGQGDSAPPFSLGFIVNDCNQPSFEHYCAIRVVLWVWGQVALSPKFFGSAPEEIDKTFVHRQYHTTV